MADKFQNGLKLTTFSGSGGRLGRVFCRWLFEWATKVVGMTDVDKSGSKWTTYVASGSDGQSVASYTKRFSIGADSHVFTVDDIGAYLTIPGITPAAFAGIYRIASIVSDKVVEIEYQFSIHSSGIPCNLTGLSWYLWRAEDAYAPDPADWCVLGGTGTTGGGYTYHLRMEVNTEGTTTMGMPKFILSPFGSWNAGSHTWDDSRYISEVVWEDWNYSVYDQPSMRVFAAGDTDRLILMLRFERHSEEYTEGCYCWHFVYLGEIDTFHASQDARPCIVWEGSNRGSYNVGEDGEDLIGYSPDSNINGRGKWLTYDDLTTVSGYIMFPHVPTNENQNWMSGIHRRYSAVSGEWLLADLLCECRDAGYNEVRGSLRRVWSTGRNNPRAEPFGVDNEYLHIIGGIVIPWSGSRCYYVR